MQRKVRLRHKVRYNGSREEYLQIKKDAITFLENSGIEFLEGYERSRFWSYNSELFFLRFRTKLDVNFFLLANGIKNWEVV